MLLLFFKNVGYRVIERLSRRRWDFVSEEWLTGRVREP